MDADLDTLCIAVYCTADDLLPTACPNARRLLTDAELVTLCVAQQAMGIPSDRRFLAVARRRLVHLFPRLPDQSGYHKRRERLAETIDWLAGVIAGQSPGFRDDLVLLDSTPVECGRSVETTQRSQLADVAAYGYSASHSRFFWGMRLHILCALDGTPRGLILAGADQGEREVAGRLLARSLRGGETVVCDKGYAGRELETLVVALGACLVRPARRGERRAQPWLAPIRQRIESCVQTLKDILTLERHGARTLAGLRARIGARILTLAAGVWLNHKLGRPSRSLVAYVA